MEALKYPMIPKIEVDITTHSNAIGDIIGERKYPAVPHNPFCKIILQPKWKI